MKLRIFQSEKGDCLMLTSKSGANMLVDGGMSASFTTHVAPYLGTMAEQGAKLDLVYVSHIDQDHISGVLTLLNMVMAWRVYDYQLAAGGNKKPPKFPRMPAIGGIWHDAFSPMIEQNAGAARDLLAQSSSVMALSKQPAWTDLASANQELAYSIAEAIQVSQRIAADQLNIPLNKEFGGMLALVRDPAGAEAKVGGMSIKVIGPFAEDLDILKDEWNIWLGKEKERVETLLSKAEKDAAAIDNALTSQVDLFLKQLGNRDAVTPPNLASLMLLVEEGNKSILLTGDGHSGDVLAGLEHQGALDGNGAIHVDVLKIPHHGSENNSNREFYERVSADHYVFCGNGEHENPDLEIVQLLFDVNLEKRPQAKFQVWFNSSSKQAPAGKPKTHMKVLESLVKKLVTASAGKAVVSYLNGSSVEFQV